MGSLHHVYQTYMTNKNQIDNAVTNGDIDKRITLFGTSMTITIVIFAVLVLINVLFWVGTLIMLIKRWKQLPVWARVLALVLLLVPVVPGGPIIALIIILVASGKGGGGTYPTAPSDLDQLRWAIY